eukprot:137984_1
MNVITTPVRMYNYNAHASINNNNKWNISPDSNLVIFSGNIKGRTMSDSGNFTKCICESFTKNLQRTIKADFNSLFVEIGNRLEEKTNQAEICHFDGTLRFNPIRFEKYTDNKENVTQPMEIQLSDKEMSKACDYVLLDEK